MPAQLVIPENDKWDLYGGARRLAPKGAQSQAQVAQVAQVALRSRRLPMVAYAETLLELSTQQTQHAAERSKPHHDTDGLESAKYRLVFVASHFDAVVERIHVSSLCLSADVKRKNIVANSAT